MSSVDKLRYHLVVCLAELAKGIESLNMGEKANLDKFRESLDKLREALAEFVIEEESEPSHKAIE